MMVDRRPRASRYASPEERIGLYSIPEPNSGCLLWTGALDKDGYGKIMVNSKRRLAHRVVYAMKHGSIDPALVIDHLCRNHACIEITHLEQVTRVANTLRGINPPAINKRKTHCKQGHELTPITTYVGADGARACRVCHAAYERERRLRKRDAHALEGDPPLQATTWQPGALMQPQSDGYRVRAVPCGALGGPDHGGLTAGEQPSDPEIDESNRRAAEQRLMSSSPIDRMEGSGF